MKENKTQATKQSVAAFLAKVDEAQRADAKLLVNLMKSATGEAPKMWGPSIIGFGSYHFKYESGREGDMPVIGFSPRKGSLVLYNLTDSPENEALFPKLGKHTTGKSCVYVKKLSDVDKKVLEDLLAGAVAHMRKKYPA